MKKSLLPIIWLLILIFGYRSYMINNHDEHKKIDFGNSRPMLFFTEEMSSEKILVYSVEHFNKDNMEDAVILYENREGHKRFVVVYSENGSYHITEERLAPVENQKIMNKNIDDKLPMEFIISGSKNGHYGYSIFRLENGLLVDIFGEGMEDCC